MAGKACGGSGSDNKRVTGKRLVNSCDWSRIRVVLPRLRTTVRVRSPLGESWEWVEGRVSVIIRTHRNGNGTKKATVHAYAMIPSHPFKTGVMRSLLV